MLSFSDRAAVVVKWVDEVRVRAHREAEKFPCGLIYIWLKKEWISVCSIFLNLFHLVAEGKGGEMDVADECEWVKALNGVVLREEGIY